MSALPFSISNKPINPAYVFKNICLLSFAALCSHIHAGSPDWAKDMVWYQIFPERFSNGDPSNDPTRASLNNTESVTSEWAVMDWESDWFERANWEKAQGGDFQSTLQHRRYGGDLQGIINKLDYLKELGISGLYLNPIFYATSLHKYDCNTFHHVDPFFGPDPEGDLALMAEESINPNSWNWTAADKLFLKLLKEAKNREIRVIIDGVWNHTGRGFFAFNDIQKKQQKSRYAEWYKIIEYDNLRTARNEFKYHGWNGFLSLPEFANDTSGNNLSPGPKGYIFNATRRWMDPNNDNDPSDGIDGWRLDVAEKIPEGFWREWHTLVRKINPKAFTSAEIWGSSDEFLKANNFDSAMNYQGFAVPVKGWLIDGRISTSEFCRKLKQGIKGHDFDTTLIMQNLIDSHDTQRVASAIRNRNSWDYYKDPNSFDFDEGERVYARTPGYQNSPPEAEGRRIWKLVALLQSTYVGAPMIFYGTELGMWGADDPEDRMPAWWHRKNQEMFLVYQDLFNLRSKYETLRRGDFLLLEANDSNQVLAFERSYKGERLVVVINRGNSDHIMSEDYLNGFKIIYSTDNRNSPQRLTSLSGSIFIR